MTVLFFYTFIDLPRHQSARLLSVISSELCAVGNIGWWTCSNSEVSGARNWSRWENCITILPLLTWWNWKQFDIRVLLCTHLKLFLLFKSEVSDLILFSVNTRVVHRQKASFAGHRLTWAFPVCHSQQMARHKTIQERVTAHSHGSTPKVKPLKHRGNYCICAKCCNSQKPCILSTENIYVFHMVLTGMRWRSWLRHCATRLKVAGSIPHEVIEVVQFT
jgi:hypothetical protein